jgi:hypothetical protein
MPAKYLLSLFMIAVLLGACATISPRIIPAPTQSPNSLPSGAYPATGNEPVSKSMPYPEQPSLPAVEAPYPPQQEVQPPVDVKKPYPGPGEDLIAPTTAYEPQPGDEKLMQGKVFLDNIQILALDSFPPQFRLSLSGNLPTPCHKLRVKVNPPDADKKIQVEVYSVFDPAEMCIQMLEPLRASVPLQGFPSGTYQVLVNSRPTGEITVP